jgi:hypothetical protein
MLVVILWFSKQILTFRIAKFNLGVSNSRNNIYDDGHNFSFCRPFYKMLHNRIT